jgi:hypothetical protein
MGGAFGSTVLDTAIGLSFVYLSLAIICTVVNEWISGVFNKRGELLKKGLEQLLDNQSHPNAPAQPAAPVPQAAGTTAPPAAPGTQAAGADVPHGFKDLFYQHPLITGMLQQNRQPAYLSSDTFAKVVMDVAAVGKTGVLTVQDLQDGIQQLPPGDVKKALLALLQSAGDDMDKAEKNIKTWYEDSMDRVSGWYKRWVQQITLLVALVLAVALNVDTLRIGKRLWQDTAVRAAIVAQAQARATGGAVVEKQGNGTGTQAAGLTTDEEKALGRLLGWEERSDNWLTWLLGVLLTTAAVSLGAPFWFDALKRFVNLRPAGRSPDEKPAK